VTNNVVPAQRKAMRVVLAGAGIRVVANKKKFIITVNVDKDAEWELHDVPERARSEYYELVLQGNTVTVNTFDQPGALWGTFALASLYKQALARNSLMPNLIVRDWPDVQPRGLIARNALGLDCMKLDDWYVLVDCLASVRMSVLGIPIYQCRKANDGGEKIEHLMVPVPQYPEFITARSLISFSAADKEWNSQTVVPGLVANDRFGNLVTYAREKGMTVIPSFDSLHSSAIIPKQIPGIAAKNGDGSSRQTGCCLSAPAGREFLETFYASILERYFESEAQFVQLNVNDDVSRTEELCQCPECSAAPREDLLASYTAWIAEMLLGKGVNKIVLWDTSQAGKGKKKKSGASVVERMMDKGLADKVVLMTPWKNSSPCAGPEIWRICQDRKDDHWPHGSACREQVEEFAAKGTPDNAEGVIMHSECDPMWIDNARLLAEYAWHPKSYRSLDEAMKTLAANCTGDKAEQFIEARKALEKAVTEDSPLVSCCCFPDIVARTSPTSINYPQDALLQLEEKGKNISAKLAAVAEAAEIARQGFASLVDPEADEKDGLDCCSIGIGEAACIKGVALVFKALVSIRRSVAGNRVTDAVRGNCADAKQALVEAMEAVEKNKPKWIAPVFLSRLSVLRKFVEQLDSDLADVRAGDLDPDKIRWRVEIPALPQLPPEPEE